MRGYVDSEGRQVEQAARRVARAHGYGSGWQAAITQHPDDDVDTDNGRLSIAHRGQVTEQAARAMGGSDRHVRRQHAWTGHGGVVAVPSTAPNLEALAAFAGMRGPLWNLMMAFACERIAAWYDFEPYLWRAVPSRNQVIAGRDAMARMMYRRAATSQDSRAVQLGFRAGDYRRETQAAEHQLRDWLLTIAHEINSRPIVTPMRTGASRDSGSATAKWWRSNRDGFAPCKRPKT